jgi:NAD-dependent SIR2 family protein deacetylase
MEYIGEKDISTMEGHEIKTHWTGNKCEECGYGLKDNIVLFGESIEKNNLTSVYQLSKDADMTIVMGTSMLVSPACDLPQINCGIDKDGFFCLINLQETKCNFIFKKS